MLYNQKVGCLMDVIQYPWVLEYRIPLQADGALDSLDDHLKIEGKSRPCKLCMGK